VKFFRVAVFIVFFSAMGFFFYYRDINDYFPITHVRIYGIEHTQPQTLQEALSPLVHRGFFSIDVDLIRERLLQEPWIADAFVRRIWPIYVDIRLIEKHPIAKWNGLGLLSTNGELFRPSAYMLLHLPQFIGPDEARIEMLRYYHEINRILQSLHVKISYFELTPYASWKIILDNGIVIRINHKDLLTRLAQFVSVYPKIIRGHPQDVEYIDLRYPYGVAVHWKTVVKT